MTMNAIRRHKFSESAWGLGIFIMLLVQTVPQPALAQTTSIEELEQRLQKAKEDKARRDAAAAKANAEAARAAPKPAAAPANTGRLVVEVDAACELRVNGERVQSLKAAEAAVITVPAGEQLIECLSAAQPGAKARKVYYVPSGTQQVLTLSVSEAEANARTADARAKPFRAVSTDAVSDARSGVLWTRSDNGQNVTGSDAVLHCRGLGSGWSLPTLEQLQSLYDTNSLAIRCGAEECRVSDLFKLGADWFWSSERNGSGQAWMVTLNRGRRSLGHTDVRYLNVRALCVRRP